jgi:hypothetical protein
MFMEEATATMAVVVVITRSRRLLLSPQRQWLPSAVIGSVVHTLPPSCSMVVVNGISYQQCGSSWYQPQFAGGNTTYVVVNAPR